MIGFRTFLVSAAAAAAFIPAAEAQNRYASQADCEANRQGRQVAGAIVGAIIGGVIGAEIEDEIDDRDNYRGRHYGYRGYHGRGYHRGRHHHYNQRHENDVAVVAGAGIGALVGAGVAGGQPCQPDYRYRDSGYYGDDYGYRDPYYNDHHSRTDYGYDFMITSRTRTASITAMRAWPARRSVKAEFTRRLRPKPTIAAG